MKRDMELIRALLLDLEEDEESDLSHWSEEQLLYHMVLLIEAELVHGSYTDGENGIPVSACALRLSWSGHEFLDSARDTTVWAKAKTKLGKTGTSVSLSVLTSLLTKLAKEQLGIQ